MVLRINSPGGVVAPTQEIFSAVERVRGAGKPVVASLGSVAASGGYYVAVAANRIFANPGTLTGSIGVIMQLANVGPLLKKVGVEYVVVKAGTYKDIGNLARPMTPEERQVLQALLDDVYGQFVTAVAERRGLDRKAVLGFADGRIYSGQQARALKMVDELGGLDEAIEAAAKLAGISGKPPVIYPRHPFSLRDLLSNQLGLGSASEPLAAAPVAQDSSLPDAVSTDERGDGMLVPFRNPLLTAGMDRLWAPWRMTYVSTAGAPPGVRLLLGPDRWG